MIGWIFAGLGILLVLYALFSFATAVLHYGDAWPKYYVIKSDLTRLGPFLDPEDALQVTGIGEYVEQVEPDPELGGLKREMLPIERGPEVD